MLKRIFVYGTLKKEQTSNWYLQGQRFLGQFLTKPKYTLYDIGAYPILVPAVAADRGRAIKGEVYEVDEEALRRLDFHENVPFLFNRQPIEVEGLDSVEAYFYQRGTRFAEEIEDEWPAEPNRHGCCNRLWWKCMKVLHQVTS